MEMEKTNLPEAVLSLAPSDLLVAPRGARTYLMYKRALDVTLASVALILFLPIMALVALLIRLSSPGPALYRQRRAGRYGRPFTIYKFRSMYDKQSDQLHRAAFERYLQGMPLDADATSVARYKLRSDPRVTPVGRFLRHTSLDELPQLWNVIRGDMSLVGPRPPILYEVERYQAYHLRRLNVTPGLTGLWQVRGRSQVTFEEMVALDLEYITTQSLALDLKIMLATIPAVCSRKGAG